MNARERLLCHWCVGLGQINSFAGDRRIVCDVCGGTGLSPALRTLVECLVEASNTLTSFATWHADREHNDRSARAWSDGADLLALHALLLGTEGER